jgi:hypothetical protein
MNNSVLSKLAKNRRLVSIFFLFFLLLCFFIANYSYYPGLSLSFEGKVDGQIDGKVYWDFGRGYNELDSIDVRLSAGVDNTSGDLGGVTVEAIGMKTDGAEGYGVWLVIDKAEHGDNPFVLEGEHEWGEWLANKKRPPGRQLKLAPGSKITFPGAKDTFQLSILENPFSGIAKVSSGNGKEAYFDCQSAGGEQRIARYSFGQKVRGEIAVVTDPYRQKPMESLPLPQQRLSGVKFKTLNEKNIKEISPAKELVVNLSGSSDKQNSLSVSIEKLIVNGRVIEWQDNRIVSSGISVAGQRMLQPPENLLVFRGLIYSAEIVLSGGSELSGLKVFLDGHEAAESSHLTSDRVRAVKVSCPITYSSVEISGIGLRDYSGSVLRYAVASDLSKGIALSSSEFFGIKQKAFHWGLLFVQIMTATMVVLLIYWLSELPIWRETNGVCELVVTLFCRHKRWFFWGIFIVGLVFNSVFLMAEWPGSMTPDSVETNREVKRLLFFNHHPYIYGILVLGLYNFFDSPLSVLFFQMICFHLLVGLFFYLLYREGVRLYILLPLYCLPLLSMPINLFNITMWKDIPFSILVLFWASFLTWKLYEKLYLHRKLTLQFRDAVFLSLLFFLVCTLRFNGLVLIPVIPSLLCWLYWGQKKGLLTLLISSALLLLTYYSLVPFVTHHKQGHSDFATHVIEKNSNMMGAVLDTHKKYFLEDYLSERTKVFVASLGTSSTADTWYTDTHDTPQEWFSVGEMRSDMHFDPQSNSLAHLLTNILKTTTVYSGFFSGRFIFWNSLFALCGMCVVFLLYKWLPVSAFYSSFFLYQALCMFFVVWPRWRYLYFVYLGGTFLLPVVMLEIRQLQLKKAEKHRITVIEEQAIGRELSLDKRAEEKSFKI